MKSIYRFSSLTLFCLAVWLLTALPVKAEGPITPTVYLPIVASNYDSSWSWNKETTPTLKPDSSYSNHPLLAIDRQGQVHIFWETIGGAEFIYHTYLTATGWTSPTAVAPSLGSSSLLYPPVVAPDGKLHLLWHNRDTYNNPYRALYAVFDHNQWGAEEQVFRGFNAGFPLQGTVQVDQQGVVHAALLAENTFAGEIYHTTRSAQGWSSPVGIPDPPYLDLIWPDRWGGIHIYGNDYQLSPTLYYSYWKNGQFIVQNRQIAGKISNYTTRLDGLNNLHLFKTDQVAVPGGQVTGLYRRCLDSNLILGPEKVLSGQNPVSNVANGASYAGLVALAWNEGSSPAVVRVAVWNGCTQIYLKTLPIPAGVTWSPHAVAVSESPNKVCILGYTNDFTNRYRVICADILQ